jgi:CheY-like chemotaxis protein
VAVATNGAEAVDAAENARYDLILMDLQVSPDLALTVALKLMTKYTL